MVNVIQKEIKCPRDRAAAVATPLSKPITRAGQHQAPISAGTERRRIIKDIINPRRSTVSSSFVGVDGEGERRGFFSPFSVSGGGQVSHSSSGALFTLGFSTDIF